MRETQGLTGLRPDIQALGGVLMDVKKMVYVDMDGTLVRFPKTKREVHPDFRQECTEWCEKTGKHHSDCEGIFKALEPMNGAPQAVCQLMERYEVYILSTAPWANISAWSDKRSWVADHLPWFPRKRLILTHRKDLNRGDYLIDDRPNNGAREFGAHEGQEWIHFGSRKFPDWESVLDYLLKQEA